MPIRVDGELEIPDDALTFTASRSGGPGGQHVNKTSSRVTLRLDVAHSPYLTDDVRRRLLERLGSRIGADGTLRVVCQSSRSQFANRRTALSRMTALLAQALAPVAERVETRVPPRSKVRRLESKRRRAAVKRLRRTEDDDA